ncbi:MAG: hypothetical protein AMXMBFR82_01010 [Candidatus Hydrogenedentota bacterium]
MRRTTPKIAIGIGIGIAIETSVAAIDTGKLGIAAIFLLYRRDEILLPILHDSDSDTDTRGMFFR